ncbi:MAG: hypothetical protein Q8Q81_05320 [Oxalobacteraceae bacterium]|nr:hypothetical protein [Oxalobacteraceae bacterium]
MVADAIEYPLEADVGPYPAACGLLSLKDTEWRIFNVAINICGNIDVYAYTPVFIEKMMNMQGGSREEDNGGIVQTLLFSKLKLPAMMRTRI